MQQFIVLLEKKRIDDPAGASAVHGVGGAWGILAVGIFASGTAGDGFNGVSAPIRGLFFGGAWHQLAAQVIGVLAGFVIVCILGYACVNLVQRITGNRVELAHETEGLDLPETGALGYQGDVEPEEEIRSSRNSLPRRLRARVLYYLLKFSFLFVVLTIVNTVVWQVLIDHHLYNCTDEAVLPGYYLVPGDWVHYDFKVKEVALVVRDMTATCRTSRYESRKVGQSEGYGRSLVQQLPYRLADRLSWSALLAWPRWLKRLVVVGNGEINNSQ